LIYCVIGLKPGKGGEGSYAPGLKARVTDKRSLAREEPGKARILPGKSLMAAKRLFNIQDSSRNKVRLNRNNE
jgi:hypothetical protein